MLYNLSIIDMPKYDIVLQLIVFIYLLDLSLIRYFFVIIDVN